MTMTRLMVLGASGSLGRHVLLQALAAGHEVTAFVRTPSKLPPEAQGRVSVHTGDLTAQVPPELLRGQDALINCAGHVADGARILPGALLLPVFASLIPQMIVPYAAAAAVMLANLGRGNAMSRHRVGLALPEGKKGRKAQWSAQAAGGSG